MPSDSNYMWVISLIFLLALMFIWNTSSASAGNGTAYYVHPDGSDENTGTSPEKPWKSIARANRQSLRPGDKLLFAGGKSFTGTLALDAKSAGTPENPVTIGSYGEGRAAIQAGTGSAVIVRDAGGIEICDLVCDGGDRTKNNGCGIAVVNTLPGNKKLKHVVIRNVDAHGFGRDIRGEGGFFPAGCGILVGGVAADGSKSGFEDILISGCSSYDNEFFGIYITGYWDEKAKEFANRNVTVRDCRMYKNTGDPDYKDNHSGSGLLVEDVDVGLVEGCTAWENGAMCNKAPGGPCGIWAAVARKVVIQNCESFRNRTGTSPDGDGFDLDGGCIECVIQYNYSHDNDGAGFLVYTYSGAPQEDRGNIVRFNVSENDAVKLRQYGAIYVGNDGKGMSGVEVYNNTFITNQPAHALVNIHGKNIGAAFRNNIFITKDAPLVKIDKDSDKILFQGNLYWSDKGFKVAGEKIFDSLDSWRVSGKETIGGKTSGILADPRLPLSEPRGEEGDLKRIKNLKSFILPSDSPAAGAGMDLKKLFKIEPVSSDFISGKISDKRYDIGACGTNR